MPELPEVENIKNNLQEMIAPPNQIAGWTFYRKDLRFPLPIRQLDKLIGQPVLKIERRAKYILLYLPKHCLIFHLGMTGHWRAKTDGAAEHRKHDHVLLKFTSGLSLVYEDPRRFGFIEVCELKHLKSRFKHIGEEPLDPLIDWDLLTEKLKKLKTPIKVALLDQKYLVGVGNIYASEILFRSKINPFKKCSDLSFEDFARIWVETLSVLEKAIAKGGSTISNFKNSYGKGGSYQENFFVYGREGLLCQICRSELIQQKKIAGRSTFWCPACQRS